MPGLDLDEVWSIKKNVNVINPDKDQRSGIHGLDLNVKKNFYSRYGNIKGKETPLGIGWLIVWLNHFCDVTLLFKALMLFKESTVSLVKCDSSFLYKLIN